MDDRPEAGLALDDQVRDADLLAEGGQPDDELDRVDVVRDDDELGLPRLDEVGDVVEAKLDDDGLLLLLVLGARGAGLRLGDQPGLLLGLVLGPVLEQQLEGRRGEVAVGGLGEARQSRGHLEALVEHAPLALEPDVARPLDPAVEVGALGRRGAADAEGLGAALVERVGLLGGGGRLEEGGGGGGIE